MVFIIGTLLSMVLSAISSVSFMLGVGLAGIGVFIMYGKEKLREVINLVDTSSLPSAVGDAKGKAQDLLDKYDIISTIGLAILIIGAFIAGVALCGGIGSCCKLKILLLVYIVINGILLFALVFGVIYTGTLKARMDTEIMKKLSQLKDEYFISLIAVLQKPESTMAVMTMSFNAMHVGLKCCGISSLGDVRNSVTWLQSERSLTEFNKQLGGATLKGYSTAEVSGKQVPAWLKPMMPAGITDLPAGVTVPETLPRGFSLPSSFKSSLASLNTTKNFTKEGLIALFSSALTLKTPLTCCKLTEPDDLIKGKFDVKDIAKIMEDPLCPFSEKNDAINQKTCYQAMLDYISKYQKLVVSVGTVLSIVLGVGVGCALWIFLFE